jgi:serine/threonine protein kinase
MVSGYPCGDRKRMQMLLDDRLPESQQTELASHLETCAICRRQLESLAAEGKVWDEAADMLRREGNDEIQATRSRAEFEPIRNLGHSAPIGRLDDESYGGQQAVLNMLDSSDDPSMLGRLGVYEIEEVIGHGGMGIVLKGFDASLNRHVAVKVLAPQLAGSAAARRRFAREAQAAAAVVHEHVVAIHAVDTAAGLPYLVMPLVAGWSLQQRIERTGPLEVRELLRIAMQAASGLAAAHNQGLVHRDVKPANILLENGVERVMLTDFGLARTIDEASLTCSGAVAGTPQYMSPEQAEGDPIDHRSDLFSLGSVMYAMATGHSPFRAGTTMAVLRRICEDTPRPLREINADMPEWLAEIVERLLQKDPNARFQTAGEVAQLLGQCLAHLQHPTSVALPRQLTGRSAALRRARRRTRNRMLAAAAVVALVGLGLAELAGKVDFGRRIAGLFSVTENNATESQEPDQPIAAAVSRPASETAGQSMSRTAPPRAAGVRTSNVRAVAAATPLATADPVSMGDSHEVTVHGSEGRDTAIWRVSPLPTPPHNVADLRELVPSRSSAATLRGGGHAATRERLPPEIFAVPSQSPAELMPLENRFMARIEEIRSGIDAFERDNGSPPVESRDRLPEVLASIAAQLDELERQLQHADWSSPSDVFDDAAAEIAASLQRLQGETEHQPNTDWPSPDGSLSGSRALLDTLQRDLDDGW